MSSLVSFDEFVEGVRACEHPDEAHRVSEDSWVWSDLGRWGDEFWLFRIDFLGKLGVDFNERANTFDVYNYIPNEGDIGLFSVITSGRSFPDVTVKELYAFIQSGFRERASA